MRTSATGEPAGAKDRKIGSHPLARYRDKVSIIRDRLSPFSHKVQEDHVRALEQLAAPFAH